MASTGRKLSRDQQDKPILSISEPQASSQPSEYEGKAACNYCTFCSVKLMYRLCHSRKYMTLLKCIHCNNYSVCTSPHCIKGNMFHLRCHLIYLAYCWYV